MKKPRFWLLIALAAGMATALFGINLFVAIRFANAAISISVMAVLSLGFLFLIMRFWRAESGSAGLSTAGLDAPAFLRVIAWLAGMLAIVGAELLVYHLTRSRVLEAVVGVALSVPSVYVLAKRGQAVTTLPRPAEMSSYRFTYHTMLVLPLIFIGVLALQLSERRLEHDRIANFDVALEFAVIGTLPVSAFFIRRGYLKARDLIDTPA